MPQRTNARQAIAIAALSVASIATAVWAQANWPSLRAQLGKVPADSALARLIAQNQDFSKLHVGEAEDRIPVPLWLRAHWKKHHPELDYPKDDPTGGYPLVLREAWEWMQKNPTLTRAPREADIPAPDLKATVGANVRISGAQPNPRSETDIAINFKNPMQVIAGSNNISGSGRQAQFFSTNGGATWGQTTLPLIAGDAFNSDPTVDWTSDGRAWATTIGITSGANALRLRAFRSTNGGATWVSDGTISGNQTATDKQRMWVDHSATSPFKDNIYVIWHNGLPSFVARRTATGWKAPIQVSGAESVGSTIGSDIKTNRNGDVFGFWPTTGGRRIFVTKSTNGGVSFGARTEIGRTFGSFDIGVPAFANRRALIYITGGAYRTNAKNNVYAAWNDLSGAAGCNAPANEPNGNVNSACKTQIWFSRSTNGGTSWSAPIRLFNRAGKSDQFNPWLAVDETNGKIGIMYYDTFGTGSRRKTHVYYQSSSNDGVTWSAPLRVTTTPSDETVAGSDGGNQYGDYNGLAGFMGKFLPAWTDRRSGGREEIWTAPIVDP